MYIYIYRYVYLYIYIYIHIYIYNKQYAFLAGVALKFKVPSIKNLLRVVQGNCLHEPEWSQQIAGVLAVLQVLDAAPRRWFRGLGFRV